MARVLRNRVAAGLAVRLVPRLLAPAVLVAAVKFLGVRQYGQLSVALALSAILSQGTELGLNQYVIRRVKEGAEPAGLLGDVLVAKSRLILVVAAIAAAWVSALHYTLFEIYLVALALTAVLVGTVGAIADALLVATDRLRANACANLVLGLGSAIFPLAFLLVWRSASGFLLGLVLANVLYALAAFAALSLRPRRDYHALWGGIRWYAASGLLEPLYSRIDLVLLGTISGAVAAGIYAPMYAPLNVIWSSGDIVALLVVGRFLERRTDIVNAAWLACLASGALATVYFAAAQPAAAFLIPGSHVTTAARAGRLLAIASVFIIPNRLLAILLRGLGAERRVAIGVGVAAGIDVAANVALDWHLGALGAATGMLVSEMVLFCLILATCPTKMPVKILLLPMALAGGLALGIPGRPYVSAVGVGGVLIWVSVNARRHTLRGIGRSSHEPG